MIRTTLKRRDIAFGFVCDHLCLALVGCGTHLIRWNINTVDKNWYSESIYNRVTPNLFKSMICPKICTQNVTTHFDVTLTPGIRTYVRNLRDKGRERERKAFLWINTERTLYTHDRIQNDIGEVWSVNVRWRFSLLNHSAILSMFHSILGGYVAPYSKTYDSKCRRRDRLWLCVTALYGIWMSWPGVTPSIILRDLHTHLYQKPWILYNDIKWIKRPWSLYDRKAWTHNEWRDPIFPAICTFGFPIHTCKTIVFKTP